jgi:hypothetical protein
MGGSSAGQCDRTRQLRRKVLQILEIGRRRISQFLEKARTLA